MKAINIGFGSTIMESRIITVLSPDSAPVKRIIQDARDRGMLVDATHGRKARAVIVCDSQHVVLSGTQAETIGNRINGIAPFSGDKD